MSYSQYQLDDFVFENRNKNFGAYELRDSYHRRLTVICAVFFILLPAALITFSYSTSAKSTESQHAPEKAPDEDDWVDVALPQAPAKPTAKAEASNPRPSRIAPDDQVEATPIPDTLIENSGPESTGEGAPDGSSTANLPGNGSLLPVEPVDVEESMPDLPDVDAEFDGGEKARQMFLQDHLLYPSKAERLGRQGSVAISFVVEKDGSLSQFRIAKGSLYEELNEEALRVAKRMPSWKPAQYKGRAVRTVVMMQINFALPEEP